MWRRSTIEATSRMIMSAVFFLSSEAISYVKASNWVWEQDSSPTRQFTDTDFEDSSPTDLKTVHRHF